MMPNANGVEGEHGSSQWVLYFCLESQKVAHFPSRCFVSFDYLLICLAPVETFSAPP
jgi:hypothetical protein